MGNFTFTRDAYLEAEAAARRHGPSVTSRASQAYETTGEIDPLVDPSKHGVIRRSINRKDADGDQWVLTVGTAMPVELRLDTTGSMGDNVDRAFKALPHTYSLLAQVPGAVLGRYDCHIANSTFNDIVDPVVLFRSQFEMDVKIAEQLTMMIPGRKGGDNPEDPQYGMFASAYLTAAEVHKLGLKSYDFTVTDATAHGDVDMRTLVRIFGEGVLDKVHENGHDLDERHLPQMDQVIHDLLEHAHAFVPSVEGNNVRFWEDFYGHERVVVLPRIELVPHVQAAIIGLTEGTLNLQNLASFLIEQGNIQSGEASQVVRAVANIPIGAQTSLENFAKIPMAGDRFEKKTDLWPIPEDEVELGEDDGAGSMWK